MLSGKPLFPGRDYHHQLTLILDVLGTPTLDEFYAITTRRSRDYIRALPFRKRRPFAQLFPNANPLAVDFLTKTLVWSPLIIPMDVLTIDHAFPDLRPEETYYSWGCVSPSVPGGICASADLPSGPGSHVLLIARPWWWARCPSTWSWVLRIWSSVPLLFSRVLSNNVPCGNSAQRWYQPRATEGASLWRDHVFPTCTHHIVVRIRDHLSWSLSTT